MIEVVGLGDGDFADLPTASQSLILQAQVLLGGARHLELVPPVAGQERRAWPTPLKRALPDLVAAVAAATAPMGSVVAVASGDPLRSGVGTSLIALLGRNAVRIHPAVSSDTLARARMGWSAEETVVVTLVGRHLDLLRRHLDPGARLVLLCSDGQDPARIAEILVEEGCGGSSMTALWHLGGPDEGSRVAQADTWGSDPTDNLVLVAVEVDRAGALARPALGTAPGLPEAAFETDGQLTKRDVRASALAHLRPWAGAVLWDLGAGSGSVGIEWARQAENAQVVAVERDPVRARRIRENAARLGVPRSLRVVEGEVLTVVQGADLPDPDAVFIGGGLTPELLAAAWDRLPPGGRLVAHAVTLGTEAVLVDACTRLGGDLTRLTVERALPLGTHLSWTPARPVVQWSATAPVPSDASTRHSASLSDTAHPEKT